MKHGVPVCLAGLYALGPFPTLHVIYGLYNQNALALLTKPDAALACCKACENLTLLAPPISTFLWTFGSCKPSQAHLDVI